jgi:hypothetical protein
MASLLDSRRGIGASAVQFFLILTTVSLFAYFSYYYIPNRVADEKRANTQIYLNVAFACTTAVISAASFLFAYYFDGSIPIVRKFRA